MSWTYWGVVGGIISLVAVFLFTIVTIYAGRTSKRTGVPVEPEPVAERRAA